MRQLLCSACGAKPNALSQHPEDAAQGYRWRRTEIAHAKKPDVHHVIINGVPQKEMETLFCDGCGEPIPDGSPAVAISQWRDGWLVWWEHEYAAIT